MLPRKHRPAPQQTPARVGALNQSLIAHCQKQREQTDSFVRMSDRAAAKAKTKADTRAAKAKGKAHTKAI